MTISLFEDLGPDLAIMARTVQSQLTTATTAFFQHDRRLATQVTEKDDQVDNLPASSKRSASSASRERIRRVPGHAGSAESSGLPSISKSWVTMP